MNKMNIILEKKNSMILLVLLMLNSLILVSFLFNIKTASYQDANKIDKLEIKGIELENLQGRETKELNDRVSKQAETYSSNKISALAVTSEPIAIINNMDFATQAHAKNWAGRGIMDDPYILENLVIQTAMNYVHAISIGNTSAYFILRNNTLQASGWFASGLYLYNVTNGMIINNTANFNTDHGFYLDFASKFNTLINNNANFNTQYGFYLIGSSNNTLTNNTANSNLNSGFYLTGTVLCIIGQFGCSWAPVYSNYNVLSNNSAINNNVGFGLTNGWATNNYLTNNYGYYNILEGVIVVVSPISTSYKSVSVNFTVPVLGITTIYIDDIANDTQIINGSLLEDLNDGVHNFTIVVIDADGNMYKQFRLFTSDATEPVITISSPTESFYNTNSVLLTYSVYDDVFTEIYIDDLVNTSLIGSDSLLTGLSDGQHNITITVTDGIGNTGVNTVFFRVDTVNPIITIISPGATTYNSGDVTLSYSVSENVTVTNHLNDIEISVANDRLIEGLSDGTYNLTIQAVDSAGNEAYAAVFFTISTSTTSTSTNSTNSTGVSPGFTTETLIFILIVLIPFTIRKRRKK